jgi:D-alanine-D-alanine ligase
MAKKKVGLIYGGMGSEREVSLKTGAAFAKALRNLGYPFIEIDAGKNLPEILCQNQIDCALLALHGKYGEDGTVQGLLEYLKIPYSGSGVLASSLAMNKVMTKQILAHWGVPTPVFQVVDLKGRSPQQITEHIESFETQIPAPFVVKPAQEGSTVGVSIFKDKAPTKSDFQKALLLAAQYDREILIEKFVPGMEITVPVWMGKALPIIEIIPKDDFYDFKRKYTPGQTEYVA